MTWLLLLLPMSGSPVSPAIDLDSLRGREGDAFVRAARMGNLFWCPSIYVSCVPLWLSSNEEISSSSYALSRTAQKVVCNEVSLLRQSFSIACVGGTRYDRQLSALQDCISACYGNESIIRAAFQLSSSRSLSAGCQSSESSLACDPGSRY